jgi:ATP-dependent Lhr-like helicase
MVYESRVGETFLLGATTWRIEEITRDRVVVTPAPGVPGKMPFWHGDTVGRPFELGQAVGEFTGQVATWSDDRLRSECDLDGLAVRNLRDYLEEERVATGGLLPTDRQLVVERFRDELGDWRVAVLSPFGARVHAPWALAIEAKIRDRLGLEVQTIWGDDGIVARLPEAEDAPPADVVILHPDEVEELVVGQLGGSALFAARFRENAARALLLPRRRPGSRTPLWQQRQRAADLLAVASKYGSFPILLETYRECLRDVFDLPALLGLMRDVQTRRVRVSSVDVTAPSPFASSLAFAYVAQFMYEGDAPLAERRAQALTLDKRMLAELVGSEELRELLNADVLSQLEAELQSLAAGKKASSLDAAADVLRRLGDLTAGELAARSAPGLDAGSVLVATGRAAVVPVGGEERFIAVEDAGRYRDGLGVAVAGHVPESLLAPVADARLQLIRRWARTHGPFVPGQPAARFGLVVREVDEVLGQLAALGQLERGEFRPDGTEREWCDVDVLRMLRHRSLAALRQEVEATSTEALARFLPARQGVGSAAGGPPGGAAGGPRGGVTGGPRGGVTGGPRAGGIDRLYEVIAQLQGVAIPASVLERDVLPSRVRDYSPRLLDELMATGEAMWLGAGALGHGDGKVVLFLRADAPGLLDRLGYLGGLPSETPVHEPIHEHLRSTLATRGACFFRDLGGPGFTDDQVLEAVWDLVWVGEVTNDSFAPLRAASGDRADAVRRPTGSTARARRPRVGSLSVLGPPRGQGRWTLVSREVTGSDPTRAGVLLARLLLERHGVLTREAVRGEGIPGGFAGVYPVLRAMEEAGHIRRGYFVAGMGGAQFALPGAVDRLRSMRSTGSTRHGGDGVLLLAATDPANAYGLALPWPVKGPQRVAGAYVVLLDGVASLYVERGGRGLAALRPFDGTWEEAAVEGLTALVTSRHVSKLAVHRYPEELATYLKAADFVPTPKGLVRYG